MDSQKTVYPIWYVLLYLVLVSTSSITILLLVFKVYAVAEKIVNSFRAFDDCSFAIPYDFFLFPYLSQFGI